MRILVLFYSTYGHVYAMAEAAAEGAREIPGAIVDIKRVPETLPREVLQKMGALEAQKAFAHIPEATPEDLENADAILFGTPTRFGNMAAQMKNFLDATGGLWQKGALVGKVGGVFTSSSTQHGGQESTILSFHITLLHHGMVVAGLPYAFAGQTDNSAIVGGSPYGASTIAGGAGERKPSDTDLAGARFQGKYAALLASALTEKRDGMLKQLTL
ncbi:MAG TPA: NAD(P)H:quinone oxidoreductase [Synergistaceae bacterium]|jgi:NAD(P)H dehydrogenase (quinone)|nr:NAD(P)H:quinone oxidoreductase [Synergistaceae bacterium]HCP08034.1 NAD(P)H:quinone oxidoreductase [Synergistaceae bacterium]